MFSKFLIARLTRMMFIPFAAGAATLPSVGGDGGGGSGAGTGTGSGGGTTGVPPTQSDANGGSSSSGQGGSSNGTGSPQSIDWNTAPQQLRDAYNTLKSQHDNWGKLGEYEVVNTQIQTFNTLTSEAYTLGEKAGYSDAQIQASLQKNFVGTINFLRQKAQEAGGNGGGNGGGGAADDQKTLDDKLKAALEPYNKDLQERQAQAANQRFDSEANRLMQEAYKDDFGAMPGEFKNLLLDAASELFKYDHQGSQDLFKNGKVAAVQKAFQQARTIVEGAFVKWQQWQMSKAGGGNGNNVGQNNGGGNGGNNGGGANKPYTGNFLDDLIQGDDGGFAELQRRRGK